MSQLSEYNPLALLSVPGAEIKNPEGIIVVVGPNSSGKTLFLRDIEKYLTTGNSGGVVCTGQAAKRPDDFDSFVKELIDRRYLQPKQKSQGVYLVCAPHFHKEASSQRPEFNLDQLKKYWTDFQTERKGNNPGWFGKIGMSLVAPLALEQRRLVADRCPRIDDLKQIPDLPIQGLFLDSEAQDRLVRETGRVFSNVAWLDTNGADMLVLRVSDDNVGPSLGQMNNPVEARKHRTIEKEGDGYRSYVGICLSLMIGLRPVALIDEPELCLHPPQAYQIGRFIGLNAQPSHATFVATHSSHVLRGLLETSNHITILRLFRKDKKFHGCLIEKQELEAVVRNPRTRAGAVLDGLFAKGVVLVESEGDREVYVAASEAIEDQASREADFVPVAGSGGFQGPLTFYRRLNIPTAIIADLDVLCDDDKMPKILKEIAEEDAETLLKKVNAVVQKVKALSPSITVDDVKMRLQTISEQTLDWDKSDDNKIRREINTLSEDIKRLKRLKQGGIESYGDEPDIRDELRQIVEEVKQYGLFFVPVGQLEDWVVDLMTERPRNKGSKTDRAMIAAEKIRTAEEKSGDVWEFVKSVLDYLAKK